MIYLIPTSFLLDYVRNNPHTVPSLVDIKHIAFIDKNSKEGFIVYNNKLKTSYELRCSFEEYERIDVALGYFTISEGFDKLNKEGLTSSSSKVCNHEYVNVGFTSLTMACKHCGVDK